MTDRKDAGAAERAGKLLERERELGALHDALDRAVAGAGGTVLVVGPGGIGKSRLLLAARGLGAERGLRVLSARCSELERSFPFGAVRQLLEPVVAGPAGREELLQGAASLAAPVFEPASIAAPEGDALHARLHGLYWLVANLAAQGPLLVVVDDAHWSDDASLAFLAYLARRIADLPVALVLGSRPADDPTAAPDVAVLLTDREAQVVHPSPLSSTAVGELVAGTTEQAPDAAFVDACIAATGGNPFLVGELVVAIAAEGLAPHAQAADRVRSLGPAGIATVVLERLRRLSPAVIALARSLAILGDGVDVRTAGAFAGLDEPGAHEAAKALEAAGVADGVRGLAFVHPIVRQAIHQDITATERGERHAAAATFVAERGGPADAVVAHLLHAPPRGDAATVALLREAGARAAAQGDPVTAAERLRRALAEPPPAADRPALLLELGRAAAHAGRAEAEEHLEACLALDPAPDVVVEASEALADLQIFSGRAHLAARVLERGIERVTHPAQHRRLADHFLTAAHVSGAVRRRFLPSVAASRDPGGPARTVEDVRTLIVLAAAGVMEDNDGARAADQARRALAGPLHALATPEAQSGVFPLAVALMAAEELASADALLSSMLEVANEAGSRARIVTVGSLRALVRLRAGDVAQAEADAAVALEMLPDAHGAEMMACAGAAAAVLAGIELGRPHAALAAILDETAYRRDPDILPYSQILLARGTLLAARHEHAAALEAFLACDREGPGWGRDVPSLIPWRSGAALALAALGRDAEAAGMAEEELRLAHAFARPRTLGIAQRAWALTGPADEREERLRLAVATLEGGPAPLELARALTDLGAERLRRGDRARARAALERAHEVAERAGATRLAALARQELRAIGVRTQATPGTGVAALTPAERRVAQLAAGGRTNRAIAQTLFLSEKTVETHLSRTFRKLGARSRRELSALVSPGP